jgi:glycerophosphoryl diester phosphodiesterase
MRKLFKVLIRLAIVIGGFWLIVNIIPCKKVIDENPFMAKETTLISAHRGGAIMNPENTKMAFDEVILDTDYTDIHR